MPNVAWGGWTGTDLVKLSGVKNKLRENLLDLVFNI